MTLPTNAIAIFASGTGSNALALIDYAQKINSPISCLICDNPQAPIVKANIDIPIYVVPFDRNKSEHEKTIEQILAKHQVNWIFLAGYMRILSREFIQKFSDKDRSRIINIHPSLLPQYKGLNAYERSYMNNDSFSGVTIHYVDSGIDTGEIIFQGKFERKNEDKLEDFINRGKKLEHLLYPKILERITNHNY